MRKSRVRQQAESLAERLAMGCDYGYQKNTAAYNRDVQQFAAMQAQLDEESAGPLPYSFELVAPHLFDDDE